VLVKKVSVLEAEGGKSLIFGCCGRERKLGKLLAQRVSVGGFGLEGTNLFTQDL